MKKPFLRKDRVENDFYPTPVWATLLLLEHIKFAAPVGVVEPANGLGGITRVLESQGHPVTTIDIDPKMEPNFVGNYLETTITEENRANWIITNPPFSIAPHFVRKALNDATDGVAMLLRLSFLEPANIREKSKRVDLLTKEVNGFKLSNILVMPRIKFDGTGKDTVTTAWFIWKKGMLRTASIEIFGPEECKKYGRK